MLEFDRVAKVVRVLSPDDTVTLQEIYDESQDWLDEPSQMNLSVFLVATGKQIFDQNTLDQTEIVLTMINDWRIEFEARLGPDTEPMQITGGTLTAINSFGNNPISPTAFTQVQFRAAHSGVILNVELIRKLLMNRLASDPNTGKIILYDDDDTSVLLEADLHEDVARTQPYRGDGADNRNRMVAP